LFFAIALKKNASTHFSTFAFAPTAQAYSQGKIKRAKISLPAATSLILLCFIYLFIYLLKKL